MRGLDLALFIGLLALNEIVGKRIKIATLNNVGWLSYYYENLLFAEKIKLSTPIFLFSLPKTSAKKFRENFRYLQQCVLWI